MSERLVAIGLKVATQAAGNALATVKLPFKAMLVGMSGALDAVTGSPTAVTVDVNDDGAAITGFTAVALGTTAGAAETVKTTHLGGTVAPVEIAADSEVDVDVNISGGSSPTAGATVVLFLLV